MAFERTAIVQRSGNLKLFYWDGCVPYAKWLVLLVWATCFCYDVVRPLSVLVDLVSLSEGHGAAVDWGSLEASCFVFVFRLFLARKSAWGVCRVKTRSSIGFTNVETTEGELFPPSLWNMPRLSAAPHQLSTLSCSVNIWLVFAAAADLQIRHFETINELKIVTEI